MTANVHLLIGAATEDEREVRERISAAYPQCEFERFSAKQSTPEELLTPSLLASADAPLVRLVGEMSGWDRSARNRFAKACKAGLPDGLMFVLSLASLGAKDPLRSIPGHEAVQCAVPEGPERAEWVRAQLAVRGVQIDPAAAERLGRAVPDAEALRVELRKLAPLRQISDSDVAELVVSSEAPAPAWGWADSVFDGDAQRALAELERLLRSDSPFMLLGVLHSRLGPLTAVHLGLTGEEAQVKPYPMKIAQRTARAGFDAVRTRRALELVVGAELELKGSSRLGADEIMVRLTLALLALTRRGR